MKNNFCFLLIAFISVGFCACSNSSKNSATNNSAQNLSAKQAIDTADTRLATDLSKFFTDQIKTGQLASTQASTQKVKAFGKQTAQLYTQLSSNLNRISESYDVKLPAVETTNLSAIKGASFDHAYLLQMLKDHNKMIREYNAAKNIQCVPLKLFVVSNQAAIIKQAYATSALKDETP